MKNIYRKVMVVNLCIIILVFGCYIPTSALTHTMLDLSNHSTKDTLTVIINGQQILFDVQPVLINGRVLVPLRGVTETLGAEVFWDNLSRTATIVQGTTKIVITVDSNTVYKNLYPIRLDVPARILNGRTMVPLRFISEAFGAVITWNPPTKSVTISYQINEKSETSRDPLFDSQWWLKGVQVPEAWYIEKGLTNPVIVAVLDSGIDLQHPDLAPKLWVNNNEIPGNNIDDDKNGYIDDTNGYNFAGITQTSKESYDNLGPNYLTAAQTIKGTGYSLSHVGITISKKGNPIQNIIVSIKESLEGSTLAFYTIENYEIEESKNEIFKSLSKPVFLQTGKVYYIVVETLNSDSDNYFSIYGASKDKYLEGQKFLSDGNAWINDAKDLYFRTNTNPIPLDDNGHGTMVSGIIGAEANNNMGIAGISHGVKIMPLKVSGSNGSLNIDNVTEAIKYAVDNGARIINMSFGYPSHLVSNESNLALKAVIESAYHNNVALIAAAGNDGGTEPYFPASYDHVISVGSLDKNFQVSRQSQNNSFVDVTAPGEQIMTTTPTYKVPLNNEFNIDLNYGYGHATSMAAPIVSGIIALVMSLDPEITPDEIESFIKRTSDDLGIPGRDDYYGNGQINGYNMVAFVSNKLH